MSCARGNVIVFVVIAGGSEGGSDLSSPEKRANTPVNCRKMPWILSGSPARATGRVAEVEGASSLTVGPEPAPGTPWGVSGDKECLKMASV